MRNSQNYWQNKVAAWMNESPLKVFDIENRDAIAKEIRESLAGLTSTADVKLIETADHIASGLTKVALPPDFSKIDEIVLKHPLVKDKSISFSIKGKDVNDIKKQVKDLLETDLAYLTKDTVPEEKARQIFNYLYFAFNKQLRKNNVGNLGAYWDIIPADTRMPDYPIWNHLGLTSAIYSSLEENAKDSTKENLSLIVYSITPVQDFISKARKLRDYWTGSVLLSYLAFIGITKVCEELGPDHIVYPSLQNQALMEQWLTLKDKNLGEYLKEKDGSVLSMLNEKSKSIASFPNKFVFLCNHNDVHEICKLIGEEIDKAWKSTADVVKKYIAGKTGAGSNERFNRIWDNAIDKYWKYSWAATNFATINNEDELKYMLPTDKWEKEFETMKSFDTYYKKVSPGSYDVSNLYGATHSLVQGLLAAGKNKPVFENVHNVQNGEKCPLCGENEVLNSSEINIKASDYNKNINEFWNKIRDKANADDENYTQVGKNERLCAVCALKRFLPVSLKDKNHLLYSTLVESYHKEKGFPSTTEMASWEYLKTVDKDKKKEIIEKLHKNEFEVNDDYFSEVFKGTDFKKYETKYYAFLLMDGDKMGDLINGETTEASWKDVLNIKDKKDTPFADSKFEEEKRKINPALHAMISDSLNNFARYGVQPCVEAGSGKLIYAGGDDVCAIMPLSTAFKTADIIRQVYQLSYACVKDNGSNALLEGEQKEVSENGTLNSSMEKIVTHLGHTCSQDKTKISLSGAIIIAHHKTPLKEIIMDAHKVLDGVAKDKSGRNSIAIRLKKRSGGDRDVWFKWEAVNPFAEGERTCRESFENVIKSAGKKELSASLLYKIEELRQSIEPLADDISKNKTLITKLFEYEIEHSGYKAEAKTLAVDIAGICVKRNKTPEHPFDWYNPEAAVIANFLSSKNMEENQ